MSRVSHSGFCSLIITCLAWGMLENVYCTPRPPTFLVKIYMNMYLMLYLFPASVFAPLWHWGRGCLSLDHYTSPMDFGEIGPSATRRSMTFS